MKIATGKNDCGHDVEIHLRKKRIYIVTLDVECTTRWEPWFTFDKASAIARLRENKYTLKEVMK